MVADAGLEWRASLRCLLSDGSVVGGLPSMTEKRTPALLVRVNGVIYDSDKTNITLMMDDWLKSLIRDMLPHHSHVLVGDNISDEQAGKLIAESYQAFCDYKEGKK